jgi:hypothetical protein
MASVTRRLSREVSDSRRRSATLAGGQRLSREVSDSRRRSATLAGGQRLSWEVSDSRRRSATLARRSATLAGRSATLAGRSATLAGGQRLSRYRPATTLANHLQNGQCRNDPADLTQAIRPSWKDAGKPTDFDETLENRYGRCGMCFVTIGIYTLVLCCKLIIPNWNEADDDKKAVEEGEEEDYDEDEPLPPSST